MLTNTPKMKVSTYSLALIVGPLSANAFAPHVSSSASTSTSSRASMNTNLNMAQKDKNDFGDILRPFGTLAIAASLAFCPISVSAQGYDYETPQAQMNAITSSSVQVSEAIKVLDMGLPSYGDIADPKASQSKIKGVPEPQKEETGSSSVLPSKKSSGNVLYSSKKAKPAKKEKVRIEKTAEEKEQDDKKPLNAKFVDMSMPTYDSSASGAKKSAFAL